MSILDSKEYKPECNYVYLTIDEYYNKDKKFGKFIENGAGYFIDNKNTPRQWLQFLCNDKIFSCVSNTGKGFIRHSIGCDITKEWHIPDLYITRDPYGQRDVIFEIDGKKVSFFEQAEKLETIVKPGTISFSGIIEDLHINILMFVPNEIPCECWKVTIKNNGQEKNIKISAIQDYQMKFHFKVPEEEIKVTYKGNVLITEKLGIKGVFLANEGNVNFERINEQFPDGDCKEIIKSRIEHQVRLGNDEFYSWHIVSGACENETEENMVTRCVEEVEYELSKLQNKWKEIIENNHCELPDKNLEYFLNYWLKNQIYLTYRYDRGGIHVGYRDGLQDSWGYLLVEPFKAKEKLLSTLSYMMADGRCPRQYYNHCKKNNDDMHDMRDFSDSIIWVADAITGYIKETGDYGILEEKLPFLGSDEVTSVENHIFRGLDSLYHLRGKNGLILVRDGDWFDGLGGINKYGKDATSVWITIAAFYAQNIMSDLYEEIGDVEKADLMKKRSAEYKKIVNEVAWDGNWFVYAFFEDGEPIGSSKNLEGKIYLNVQTWAILSGIVDDEDKIKRIRKSIYRYLQTPFGPLLNYPPYVFYGERCGRVQKQRPGTFGNSAVYNHAASFKTYADVALGDFEEALDTLQRALPNHPDNSDLCRTSEPYCVGNVYFGPNNSRYGMNLFSWFTATPSWLIHGGFEAVLGVKAGYKGLLIEPHVSPDWNKFSVNKKYRDTMYHITFERGNEKGIWIDGEKQTSNCINYDKEICYVNVKY